MKISFLAKLLFVFAVLIGSFAVPISGTLHAETVQAPTDISASGELAFWNKIKKSETAADFEVYFTTFPNGMFTEIARTRYDELGGKATIESPKAEEPIVAEPEVEPTVATPKIKKKATVAVEAKPKKRAASVFVKKKKAKNVVAYVKARKKVKNANYAPVKPKRKIIAKSKTPRVAKVKYVKPKTPKVKKKVYVPSAEPSGIGGGDGGGSTGGGGGGWGG